MSRPRYRWWGFVRRMVADYRGLKAAHDELHQPAITAAAATVHAGGISRSTENVALRQLARDDQAAFDAVSAAIASTRLLPEGPLRLKLIQRMYWARDRQTLDAAAAELFISYRTARRYHAQFIQTVAVCYGFEL